MNLANFTPSDPRVYRKGYEKVMIDGGSPPSKGQRALQPANDIAPIIGGLALDRKIDMSRFYHDVFLEKNNIPAMIGAETVGLQKNDNDYLPEWELL